MEAFNNTKKPAAWLYSAAILLSGSLWGTMGLFRRGMGDLGLSTTGVILLRCGLAALCFGLTILLTGRAQFRVRWKDLWCFLGSGVVSLLFFTLCYFQAMTLMSLSTAAILLYTAPCFVILMSALLFHDRVTGRILLAMLLAFAGCCLVSGIMGGGSRLSLIGILYGLGSGIGYALYTIFGKLAMQRNYGSLTINFYSCLFAALGASLISVFNGDGFLRQVTLACGSGGSLLFCVAAGLVTCYFPYLLYTWGLTGTQSGKASIMASVEPVVATLVGMIAYREYPDLWAVLGIALVLAAIVLTNLESKKA